MALMYKIYSSNEGSGITIIFSNGTIHQLSQDSANFQQVVDMLTKNSVEAIDEAALEELVIPAVGVNKNLTRLSERVTFDGANIRFDGDIVSDAVASHILRIIKEGGNVDSYKALVAFMEKLYTNPSKESRDNLYDFIVRHNITIDPDGDFYAYKGVKANGGSVLEGFGIVDGVPMTGSLPNKPGSVLEIPRSTVVSDRNIGCGIGLHAGTYEYAKGWSRGVLLLVKINPRDVVSVPECSTFQKLRTCRYKVITQTIHQIQDTTASVNVIAGLNNIETLAEITKDGGKAEATFTYTRGNGETIKVKLTVTEVRKNDKEFIVIGQDANGETRSYRSSYITDLEVDKSALLNKVGIKTATVAPKAASVSASDDVTALCEKVANGETVVCDFNYVTVDGEARSVKNFSANGVRVAGWAGHNLLIGEREDGETRSYRADRITDLVVRDELVKALATVVPTLTQADLDNATPLDEAILRAAIASGEKVTVSFDYTKVNGESRSLKNFVAEEIKSYNKELLVGTREDGETRTYRLDLVKNLVVQDDTADDEADVDMASIKAALPAPVATDAVSVLKSRLQNGEELTLDFTYTKKSGEVRKVKNFKADSAHRTRVEAILGEREDGKYRSYRLDRMTDIVIHEKVADVPSHSVFAVKSFVLAGSFVVLSFDYTTVTGENRSVKNFTAQSVKDNSLLIGEREDEETRSYRLDRIKNVVIHKVR